MRQDEKINIDIPHDARFLYLAQPVVADPITDGHAPMLALGTAGRMTPGEIERECMLLIEIGEIESVTKWVRILHSWRAQVLLDMLVQGHTRVMSEEGSLTDIEMESMGEAALDALRMHLRQDDAPDRSEIIAEWAAEYGSDRLRDQIEMGLDGWPLYLHERLAHDFSGLWHDVVLRQRCKKGGVHEIKNPDREKLDIMQLFAAYLETIGHDDWRGRLAVVRCADPETPYIAIRYDGWRPFLPHMPEREYTIDMLIG